MLFATILSRQAQQKQSTLFLDLVWQFILKILGRAKLYVQTDGQSGQLQLELLKKEGLTPESRVLEFGCLGLK